MNEIRAFVGHSFLEGDASLVANFLKYFDRIAKLNPNFSWEHAEAAEPRLLADKVLSLVANKNVFIGICTKKERAIANSGLITPIFKPTSRMAKEEEFQWKTSDWIIQEIGLAKGRGLDLILLLEDGIREPGGLQGDVEYISFDRNAPEKCFGKILEMITALTPRIAAKSTISPETKSSDIEAKDGKSDSQISDELVPQASWDRKKYDEAIFRAIIAGKNDAARAIDRSYIATDDAKQGDNVITWAARNEWLRISYSKGETLDRLKNLAKENPQNVKVLDFLARAFAEYDQNAEAAVKYDEAAKQAADEKDKARYTGLAAIEYARDGQRTKAVDIIQQLRSTVGGDLDQQLTFLKTLRKISEIEKDDIGLIASMEGIVDLAPDDMDVRFSLAHKHFEMGNREVAYSHYRKIPYQLRQAGTWNNLGVLFDNFKMPGKAVQAYRELAKMGETLAMSNLGYKYFNAGFLPEAQAECDKAFALKNYHKQSASPTFYSLKRLND